MTSHGRKLPLMGDAGSVSDRAERFIRQVRLAEVGDSGQRALFESKVLVLGAGGLGSPTALYLAAAGVGTLGIVDHDVVEISNLHRQLLHTSSRVGQAKVESARIALSQANPEARVVTYEERVTASNASKLMSLYDIVVDGTDNFPTRYAVNDAAVALGKPVVHGSVFRWEGQVTTFVSGTAPAAQTDASARGSLRQGFDGTARSAAPFSAAGPCYRCLFPEPPPAELAPSCQEAGVMGVLCGIIGTLQATEAIKLVLRAGTPLVGRLLTYDALSMRFREMTYERNPACATCGTTQHA